MYNTQKPSMDELPSTARLLTSTAIAFVSASVILVGAVLPAEYGIDPTGLGRVLGLKDMGEIKAQLSAEADADRQAIARAAELAKTATPEPISVPTEEKASPLQSIAKENVLDKAPVVSPEPKPVAEKQPELAWRDEVTFTLTPGEGIEIKLVMAGQAEAYYAWSTDKGVVNYDTHGDGGGRNISYEKGRGVASDEGLLKAAFTGNHGWFWRNRMKEDVSVTLKTRGDYKRLKR